MFKIPSTLKIGAHTWSIKYKELNNILGETNWNEQVIYLEEKMSQDMKEATLLHEILHCCNPTLDGTDLGHSVIDSLAEQLYQALRDNNILK